MSLSKVIQRLTLAVTALAFICVAPSAHAETTDKKETKPAAKEKTDTTKKAPAAKREAAKVPAAKREAAKAPAAKREAAKAPAKRAVATKPAVRKAKAKSEPKLSRVQLLLKNTDNEYNKTLSMQIKSKDLATQKKEFMVKQALFTNLSKKLIYLTKVTDRGVAVCALYRLGIANSEMAESVNEAPLPNRKGKKWSKAEAKAYRANLQKTVGDKYLAQAKVYYKQAVAVAKKDKIKNHCAQNANLTAKHMK